MAKVLAAMAMVPSGATMTVEAMYPPRRRTFCRAIGPPMSNAFPSTFEVGLNEPLSCSRFSSGERTTAKYNIKPAVIISARPVPTAAPTTPIFST